VTGPEGPITRRAWKALVACWFKGWVLDAIAQPCLSLNRWLSLNRYRTHVRLYAVVPASSTPTSPRSPGAETGFDHTCANRRHLSLPMQDCPVRPTRVIYVENDPALRGIMSALLDETGDVELLLSTGIAHEALDPSIVEKADVALLDLALGTAQMNGIDLGLAMRALNDNIGIVIHSQFRLNTVARTVPADALIGWATLPKSGDLDMETLVHTLRETARGVTNVPESAISGEPSPLEQMTMRQRAVMGMAAAGVASPEIARRLNVSHDAVRQDLSAVYRILIPDATSSDDRRTRAVLAYLAIIHDDHAIDGP
jgi:DNA-binding NarL/FixJ family response regulator